MAWLVLIVSGMLEAVWATAMSQSNGFTRLWPSIVWWISSSSAVCERSGGGLVGGPEVGIEVMGAASEALP